MRGAGRWRRLHEVKYEGHVDRKHDDSADDGPDEPCSLVGAVPSDRLPKVGSDTDDADQRRHDEAGRMFRPRSEKLCDQSRDETDLLRRASLLPVYPPPFPRQNIVLTCDL
jgi:hypothetical protein